LTAKACGAPGYINPVGPIVDVLFQKPGFAVDKAVAYIAAEFAGAFTGAVIVWLHYQPHWRETTDPGAKLGVFCTAPAIRSLFWNLLSETIATFVLVFVGAAIVEKEMGRGFVAPLGGALVWGIGLSLGGTTGY